MEVLPDFYSEVFHERDRTLPIARAAGWSSVCWWATPFRWTRSLWIGSEPATG
jgi:hypothetical protein